MMRFALRSFLFISILFLGLVGAVILAAGGLRPTRFLLIQPPDQTLSAVLENGQVETLTRPGETVQQVEIFDDYLRWVTQDNELLVWENGQRQVLSQTSLESYVVDYRLDRDSFVWTERETTPETIALRLWDGSHTITVSSGMVAAIQITWLSDGRLWWLEQLPGVNAVWQVMQWDGRKTTRLMRNLERVHDLQFLACGAFWLHEPDGSPNRLVIWNGQVHTLMVPDYIRALRSQDCQTFLLLNEPVWSGGRTPVYRWSGGWLEVLPSPLAYLIDDDLLLTIDPAVKLNGRWQMNLWQDGQLWHSLSMPFAKGRPILAPPLLGNETLIIFVIEGTYPNGDLYAWGLESGQLRSLTTPQTRSFMAYGIPFRWFGQGEDSRVAWCSRDPHTQDAAIYAWEPGNKTVTLVQPHAECMMRAMNDGSLVGMTQAATDSPPGYFRWDGHQVTVFATRPENLQTSLGFSDWIMWE